MSIEFRWLRFATLFCMVSLIAVSSAGQVLWTEPQFPTQNDDVTVYFDAAQGDMGLKDFNGDVYAHTGVITNNSNHGGDWKHVQGTWGIPFPKTKMTALGNDRYSISFNITEFYNIPNGVQVQQLAFVFRNTDGSRSGRAADGSDLYTPVYTSNNGLILSMDSPEDESILLLGEPLSIRLQFNKEVDWSLTDNQTILFEGTSSGINTTISPQDLGEHRLLLRASDGTDTIRLERAYFLIDKNGKVSNPPVPIQDGLNYTTDSYIFQIYAPRKDFVFFLCPLNDFKVDLDFRMNKAIDNSHFWIELPKEAFESGEHIYQYLVDGTIRTADPYSVVVLDPSNDVYIDDRVLAEIPAYPPNARGIVTVFDAEPTQFDWQYTDYERPAKSDLVVYELLMRDFLQDHSYISLLDTLDYLERLGVNAIQLMPVNEFEGNVSWGYNPSFHMALDKYYGTREEFKRVIDEAHKRGIAVILDVVYNHVFSQSPLAQLYWDQSNFRPSDDNPWLNVTARHPFNVGYDVNHESPQSQYWVKRMLRYWVEEFKVDGFRFDLSKGFTQKNSGTNAALMSAYDQSRINILNSYAQYIWSIDPQSYVILEHFADNNEEKELARRGMMLWGNINHDYAEAAMGYPSNLFWSSYANRGWEWPALVTYMESHDEERLRFKAKMWGNVLGDYDARDQLTSMNRLAGAASVFFSTPGPKMIWQFGELGYDFSINRCEDGTIDNNCRLSPKPIRWNYYDEIERRLLWRRYQALIHLKKELPAFESGDFDLIEKSNVKAVILRHAETSVVTVANLEVREADINLTFPNTGTWYDYFTGETLEVASPAQTLVLAPGEYRLYTSEKLIPPGGYLTPTKDLEIAVAEIFPNPAAPGNPVTLVLPEGHQADRVFLINHLGGMQSIGFEWSDNAIRLSLPNTLPGGQYLLFVQSGKKWAKAKLTVAH